MASLADQIKYTAQVLITAASFGQGVQAADIRRQASQLQSNYADYSVIQISQKIAAEIRQRHNPGVSGSCRG